MTNTDAKNKQIDVSVLMTCFNHQEFISEAIRSVHRQVFAGTLELIVADDCSSDNTCAEVAHWQKIDPRIVVCAGNDRLGVSRNFARALARARGKYIAILDGDDYWLDLHKCQRQFEYLQNHPEVVGVFEAVSIVDQQGQEMRQHFAAEVGTVLRQSSFVAGYPLTSQTLMLRRAACASYPSWGFATPCQDWVIAWSASAAGPIVCTGGISAAYRQSSASVWTALSPRRKLKIFLQMAKLLNLHGALSVNEHARELQYQAAYRSFRDYVDHDFSLIDALMIAWMISAHAGGTFVRRFTTNAAWVVRTYLSRMRKGGHLV